jgi:ankyrin repeat protein
MAEILLDNKCNPNQMNNKSQSPLMIALQAENFILVDYLIDKAKVDINSNISYDGKTLLHYFAKKCDKYNLIQLLLKLVSCFFLNLYFNSKYFFIANY